MKPARTVTFVVQMQDPYAVMTEAEALRLRQVLHDAAGPEKCWAWIEDPDAPVEAPRPRFRAATDAELRRWAREES